MVVDDAKHIKRIKKIFQNKISLEAHSDAMHSIKNNMHYIKNNISWINEGLVGFSNTIDRSKFSSDSKISMLKKSVKYSKQSILFQKHFNSLIRDWIKQNYKLFY
jgi:hypothetical protein